MLTVVIIPVSYIIALVTINKLKESNLMSLSNMNCCNNVLDCLLFNLSILVLVYSPINLLITLKACDIDHENKRNVKEHRMSPRQDIFVIKLI